MIISYKGKTLETKHYYDLSEEQCYNIKSEYYKKPNKIDVIKQIKKIFKDGSNMNHITNYYFKDIMSKVRLYHSKWSIEEVFECNDLIKFFYAKTLENKSIFPDEHSDTKKIETALRLGGKGVASKPSNFPLNSVCELLSELNINNNYYDFSCGWGVRLTGALKLKINYFGTDPNNILVERLETYTNDFKKETGVNSIVDIRCQGSEYFVPEWENTIGVAFSSPPYFGLEDYRVGEQQSYKEGVTYEEWRNGYLNGTISNIYKYLVKGGVLAININDYNGIPLTHDTKMACLQNGFDFIGKRSLKNIQRTNSNGGHNDNSEDIMLFKKI
jgi:hypothetical protein